MGGYIRTELKVACSSQVFVTARSIQNVKAQKADVWTAVQIVSSCTVSLTGLLYIFSCWKSFVYSLT
jgi:hypothetical protein